MFLAEELDVALSAARAASTNILEHYGTDFAVEYKGHNDPVTVADRDANTLIVAALQRSFPHDAICSEESASEESARAAARGGRCWFVDPLDGTREFVDRNGEFCVMVGLCIDGTPALGVLVAPALDRTFVGIVGHGAWELNRQGRAPLRLPDALPPEAPRATSSRSHPHPIVARASRALGVERLRPFGSVGLKVSLVATGEVDLYMHFGRGPKLWDGCAPEAIARAAGAIVTDARGLPIGYHTDHLGLDEGIIVAHPALHARAVQALQEAISAA